jgi:predicted transcriptional regulator
MDFKTAAKLGAYISKDYAEDLFELLVNYQDISASEAASRLNLHIRTVQEFLEAMVSLDILSKEEVHEKKRPYFRYRLNVDRITMDIDLSGIKKVQSDSKLNQLIREKKDAGARFSLSRNGDSISSVAIWTGEGRERKERKISLTTPQGVFLFHLPFPNADPLTLTEIVRKSEVDDSNLPEILDIVDVLEKYEVIEVQ